MAKGWLTLPPRTESARRFLVPKLPTLLTAKPLTFLGSEKSLFLVLVHLITMFLRVNLAQQMAFWQAHSVNTGGQAVLARPVDQTRCALVYVWFGIWLDRAEAWHFETLAIWQWRDRWACSLNCCCRTAWFRVVFVVWGCDTCAVDMLAFAWFLVVGYVNGWHDHASRGERDKPYRPREIGQPLRNCVWKRLGGLRPMSVDETWTLYNMPPTASKSWDWYMAILQFGRLICRPGVVVQSIPGCEIFASALRSNYPFQLAFRTSPSR